METRLYTNGGYVLHGLDVSRSDAVMSFIFRTSYGTHLLNHLAADGAGLAGGQVAVVAVLEVDAHLIGGLHLELVHGLTGLGDVDAVAGGVAAGVGSVVGRVGIVVAVAHDRSLLLSFRKSPSVGVFCPGVRRL